MTDFDRDCARGSGGGEVRTRKLSMNNAKTITVSIPAMIVLGLGWKKGDLVIARRTKNGVEFTLKARKE